MLLIADLVDVALYLAKQCTSSMTVYYLRLLTTIAFTLANLLLRSTRRRVEGMEGQSQGAKSVIYSKCNQTEGHDMAGARLHGRASEKERARYHALRGWHRCTRMFGCSVAL